MEDRKILIIDDDEGVVWVVKKVLEPLGYSIETKSTIRAGIKVVDRFRLIFLDLRLPDGSGIDALADIKVFNPEALVIIITAHGRMENVIDAMKEGAYDYLEKPFDIEELRIVVEKAFRDIAMRQELLALRQKKDDTVPLQMVGKSRPMLKVFKEIGRIAPKDITVLISGESGTGKELVAKAIHNNSRRKLGPFIALNSASIPRELLEAELFGWAKGAFTGAAESRPGKISSADGGTLFLDEIAELDIELQAKLLRFLQEHEYSPLGSNRIIKANVRIIGATNKDLRECVKSGRFREDLYYRFNVIEIEIPPLRERRDDIIALARYFLEETVRKYELTPKDLSEEARNALLSHDWPGNVRELENTIRRASILSKGSVIEKKDLFISNYSAYSVREFLEDKLDGFLDEMRRLESSNLYDAVISEVEKALIGIVLKETQGNQLRAAKMLGINRNTLFKKIKAYRIL